MKKAARFFCLFFALLMLIGTLSVSAMTPYSTYTYDIKGEPAQSPDAYTPDHIIDSDSLNLLNIPEQGKGVALDSPRDIVVDDYGNLYIADANNDRVIVCNRFDQYKFMITEFVNNQGVPDSLDNPNGLFIRGETLYVADTDNNRIVVFDLEGNYKTTIEEPKSDVFPDNSIYKPVALAVDQAGRMYIVSSTTYMGVISINPDGEFQGFIGAEEVTLSPWVLLWRNFQTKEQRESMEQYVSTEYNNIDIDEDGFIYVTTNAIDPIEQQDAITSKVSKNAPVKKLNTAGTDILKRNGFFGPGGEVKVLNEAASGTNSKGGASSIVDVALGPEGTWSIIDDKRQKIYTYDEEGILLFIFGDSGMQTGNLTAIKAIEYRGTDILVLDKTACNVTVYRRTEYGDLLISALKHNRDRQYDVAKDDWQSIVQRNSNYDQAYIGIGKALFRSGDYEGAMSYYQLAHDTDNYSEAFSMWRQDWVKKYALVVVAVIAVVIAAYVLFFRYANKLNVKGQTKTGKYTFWEEIMYGFWIIFHPFDGFWDLKHERRGSLRGAFFWIGVTILSFTYMAIGSAYLVNPYNEYTSIVVTTLSVTVPFLLWCAANWMLTTLFDGEGSFKDIFIATAYALVPMNLFIIPVTLVSHCLIQGELAISTLLLTISYIWTGFLIFFGSMTTHDYTFGKNLIISVCTIVGMAFIMFVAILFSGLASNIIGFVTSIVVELSYRV